MNFFIKKLLKSKEPKFTPKWGINEFIAYPIGEFEPNGEINNDDFGNLPEEFKHYLMKTASPHVSKNFRFRSKKVHLTYPEHIDPEKLLTHFKVKLPKYEVIRYSIVQEIGESGHKHTHALLEFKTASDTCNPRIFDFPRKKEGDLHPNIASIVTKTHWENTVLYHQKQSKPFTNIVKELGPVEKAWSNPNLENALVVAKKLSDVGGIIMAWKYKPKDYGLEPEVNWRPWQKELLDEVTDTKPDPRRVIWYNDPDGSAGKTFFTKHMGKYRGAFTTTNANIYHVATALEEYLQNGVNALIVVFNFTRQQENHKVYQAIEELKDGMVTSQKYKGKTMYFEIPHVIVFANYQANSQHLSKDRWDLRTLSCQGDIVVERIVDGQRVSSGAKVSPLKRHETDIISEKEDYSEKPKQTPEVSEKEEVKENSKSAICINRRKSSRNQ